MYAVLTDFEQYLARWADEPIAAQKTSPGPLGLGTTFSPMTGSGGGTIKLTAGTQHQSKRLAKPGVQDIAAGLARVGSTQAPTGDRPPSVPADPLVEIWVRLTDEKCRHAGSTTR